MRLDVSYSRNPSGVGVLSLGPHGLTAVQGVLSGNAARGGSDGFQADGYIEETGFDAEQLRPDAQKSSIDQQTSLSHHLQRQSPESVRPSTMFSRFSTVMAVLVALSSSTVLAQDGTRYEATTGCASLTGSCGPNGSPSSQKATSQVSQAFASTPPSQIEEGKRYGCVDSAGSDGGQFCAITQNTHPFTVADFQGYLGFLASQCGSSSCSHITAHAIGSLFTDNGAGIDVEYFAKGDATPIGN